MKTTTKDEYDQITKELREHLQKFVAYHDPDSDAYNGMSTSELKENISEISSLYIQSQILLNKINENYSKIDKNIQDNDKQPGEKVPYRTKAKAKEIGAITEPPKRLIIPTLKSYQNSMSLTQEGGAYLQPLKSTDGLTFQRGKLFFEVASEEKMREVSEVELQNLKTKEGIEHIDLPLLRVFYSIILTDFERSGYNDLQDVIKISVPSLAGYIGLKQNLNKKDIDRIVAKTQSYHNICGIVHATRNGRPTQSIYPVLNFEGFDDKTNTVSFSSPYMNYVIRTVYNLSLRKKKDGTLKLKNGQPDRKPTHSYLIDSSIAKERNRAAVENVVIIVTLIEQVGSHLPNIRVRTLINRNVQLAERLENSKNPRALLQRTFKKTWELLRTKTRLQEYYKDIQLPKPDDPAFMPTMATLDEMVLRFPHNGKKSDKELAKERYGLDGLDKSDK